MKSVCIYCGSSVGTRPIYLELATAMGHTLAQRGITLVYGGAAVGLMGAVADAALAAGGRVIGVIPRSLEEKEIAHGNLSELHIVESMHARKAMLIDLSDALIALPGGFGTWDELCEAVTWGQLGVHTKPCGLLNAAGYYDGLLAQLDHAITEGFVHAHHRDLLVVENDVERLIDRVETHRVPQLPKWVGPAET
ncbi:MAG: TIGR00730 family Rossman fold protein [Chloroflexi bacterium]|nr:TIGR00730 family Rossman fold protein [Chloroflexota bacterium]